MKPAIILLTLLLAGCAGSGLDRQINKKYYDELCREVPRECRK